jgi:hypothetical protein
MPLTDSVIRAAKAGDKDRKLTDEKGLYLLVSTSGSKLWRLKYRFAGKEKKLALGAYPEISLKEHPSRAEHFSNVSSRPSLPSISDLILQPRIGRAKKGMLNTPPR